MVGPSINGITTLAKPAATDTTTAPLFGASKVGSLFGDISKKPTETPPAPTAAAQPTGFSFFTPPSVSGEHNYEHPMNLISIVNSIINYALVFMQ